jgi:hypothetical protein
MGGRKEGEKCTFERAMIAGRRVMRGVHRRQTALYPLEWFSKSSTPDVT